MLLKDSTSMCTNQQTFINQSTCRRRLAYCHSLISRMVLYNCLMRGSASDAFLPAHRPLGLIASAFASQIRGMTAMK